MDTMVLTLGVGSSSSDSDSDSDSDSKDDRDGLRLRVKVAASAAPSAPELRQSGLDSESDLPACVCVTLERFSGSCYSSACSRFQVNFYNKKMEFSDRADSPSNSRALGTPYRRPWF